MFLSAPRSPWPKATGAGVRTRPSLPRAVERLETCRAPAPAAENLPPDQMGGKLIEGIFAGETINTPSMLCVADAIDALDWMEGIGGLAATRARADANAAALQAWVDRTPWVENLVADPAERSNTSVCLHRRPGDRRPRRGRPARLRQGDDQAPRGRGRRLRHRRLSRRARRACASGAAPPSTPPTSRRSRPGSTGPSPPPRA